MMSEKIRAASSGEEGDPMISAAQPPAASPALVYLILNHLRTGENDASRPFCHRAVACSCG
jgi:hypothetical protein